MKEVLGEMSIPDWPSFIETLHIVEDAILTSAYSILAIMQLQTFHFGTSEILEEYTLTYLRPDSIHSHSWKAVYEIRTLGRRWMYFTSAAT